MSLPLDMNIEAGVLGTRGAAEAPDTVAEASDTEVAVALGIRAAAEAPDTREAELGCIPGRSHRLAYYSHSFGKSQRFRYLFRILGNMP